MYEPKDGEYFFVPRNRNWAVYRQEGNTGKFIQRFEYKDQARNFVYEKNGWKNKYPTDRRTYNQ